MCLSVNTGYLTAGYYPIVKMPDQTSDVKSVIKIITVVYFTALV